MKKLAIIKHGNDANAESYLKAIKRRLGEENVVVLDLYGPTIKEIRNINRKLNNNGIPYLILEPFPTELKVFFDGDIEKQGKYPITPTAIYKHLAEMVDLEGKTACVINRTDRIGKPLANMLIDAGATVCICNSKTNSEVLKHMCLCSDIVITATNGKYHYNPMANQIVIDCSNDVKPEYCYKYTTTSEVDKWTLEDYCKYISTSEVGRWTLDELERRMEEH